MVHSAPPSRRAHFESIVASRDVLAAELARVFIVSGEVPALVAIYNEAKDWDDRAMVAMLVQGMPGALAQAIMDDFMSEPMAGTSAVVRIARCSALAHMGWGMSPAIRQAS